MDQIARLKRFQAEHRGLANSRQAFDAKRISDSAFAAEIESLYSCFIGTFRRYCGNCWHDAFLEILTLKNMDNNSHFRVLAGTLLHDPVNCDVKYMLTPRRLAVMGDELALRHLAHNPHAADYFEKPLPENLERMISAYLKREAADSGPVETEKAGKRKKAENTKVKKAVAGARQTGNSATEATQGEEISEVAGKSAEGPSETKEAGV